MERVPIQSPTILIDVVRLSNLLPRQWPAAEDKVVTPMSTATPARGPSSPLLTAAYSRESQIPT